jgi:hypothetical protein
VGFAEPQSWPFEFKPDVGCALAHAPAAGDILNDLQSPPTDLPEGAMMQCSLKARALVDDLDEEAVAIQTSAQGDLAPAVTQGVARQFADEQLGLSKPQTVRRTENLRGGSNSRDGPDERHQRRASIRDRSAADRLWTDTLAVDKHLLLKRDRIRDTSRRRSYLASASR